MTDQQNSPIEATPVEWLDVHLLHPSPLWDPAPPSHTWHELLMPSRGPYAVKTESGLWRLTYGEGVFFPAGVPHTPKYDATTGLRLWCLQWTEAREGKAARRLQDDSGRLRVLLAWLLDIKQRSRKLTPDEASVAPIMRLIRQEVWSQGHDLLPSRLDTVLAHLDIHLQDGVGVAELAQVAGLSRSHLVRLFQRELGRSPSEEITRRRLERIHALLTGSGMTLTNIADAVGFRNADYLSTFVRRHTGLTPGEIRRRAAGARPPTMRRGTGRR